MSGVKIRECGRVFKGVSDKAIDVIGECLVAVIITPSTQTFHIAVVVPDHHCTPALRKHEKERGTTRFTRNAH